MSIINLELEMLKTIKTEIDVLTELLQNEYFVDIDNELSAIKNNIQGEELHAIINNLNNHINSIKSNINKESKKLSEFLEGQLKNYNINEEELEAQLLYIINKMLLLSGKEPLKEGFGAYVQTLGASALSKFFDLSAEGVIDAHLYGTSKILQLFGLDDKWAEDIISYEVIDYDKWVSNVSPDIAHGKTYAIGNVVGTAGGYAATSAIPTVGTALCAFAGAGSKAEESINSQKSTSGKVNDLKVFGDSLVGSAEGYSVAQMGNVFKKPFQNISSATSGSGNAVSTSLKTARDLGVSGAGQVIKETPKYIVKDSRTWITAGANDTQQALSKIGGYEETNKVGTVVGTAFPNMGAAGIDVIAKAIK